MNFFQPSADVGFGQPIHCFLILYTGASESRQEVFLSQKVLYTQRVGADVH
jgi:hypothetical protein